MYRAERTVYPNAWEQRVGYYSLLEVLKSHFRESKYSLILLEGKRQNWFFSCLCIIISILLEMISNMEIICLVPIP